MSQPELVRARILVIEDDPPFVDNVLECLKGIPQRDKKNKGVSGFEISTAESVEEAKRLLTEAQAPFHLVLLDLRLPMQPGGAIQHEHGFALLRFIQESRKVKGVIIMSILTEYQRVVEGFHGGAIDFVTKPFDVEGRILSASILNAMTRVLAEESERIIDRRVRVLAAYAEVGLVHSFKRVFKDLDDAVTKAAEGVEKYARTRFKLDRHTTPNDALIVHLDAHRRAVTTARRDWAGLQSELAPGGKQEGEAHLGRTLADIKEELLSCLAVKRVAFEQADFGEMSVMTFEDDVSVVLREIVLGALSEMPDYGEVSPIRVGVSTDDTVAVVTFEDRLRPLPDDKVTAINERQRVLPDAEFGRVWGLSVAQHVALRGGGSLKVAAGGGRNVVTYRIPLYSQVEPA